MFGRPPKSYPGFELTEASKAWGLYYKTFYGCNLRIFRNRLVVFVSREPFQPSLVFLGESLILPQCGAPERCFTQVCSGLTHKDQIRLKRLARDKHSGLLRKSINQGRKKFYSTGPWGQFPNLFGITSCPLFIS